MYVPSENGKWALSYAKRGIKVFPLHYPIFAGGAVSCSCGNKECTNIGKHPLTPHGFSDATDDLKTVERYWMMHPNANIGIATGAMSGFDVIDVDQGGEDSFHMLEEEHGQLPDTVTVLTGGGGTHYWVLHIDGLTSKVGILPHLDIRSDGGYVVAPPSIHRSGNPYVFDAEGDFTEGVAPCDCPPSWVQILSDLCRKKQQERPVAASGMSIIPEGTRNKELFRIACAYRSKGLSEAALFAAVKADNLSRCKPPMTDSEVDTICRQAVKYPSGHSEEWDREHPKQEQKAAETGGQEPTDIPKKAHRFQGGGKLSELAHKEIKPINWIWSERITSGLLLYSGAQKMGKSFMALELALAISEGRPYLGRGTKQGDICYLALEDTEARIHRRVSRILGRLDDWPEAFEYYNEAEQQGNGLEEQIQTWCDEHPNRRMVIIDTYGMIKKTMRTAGTTMTAYDADVRQYKEIKKIADKNDICIMLVTHKRKGANGDDVMDTITGSLGQSATADMIFTLNGKRKAGEGGKNTDLSLHIQGRDTEPDELPLDFDGTHWKVKEGAAAAASDATDRMTAAFFQWAQQIVSPLPQHKWHGSTAALQKALTAHTLTMHASFRDAFPRGAATFARDTMTDERIAKLQELGVAVKREEQRRHGEGAPGWTVTVTDDETEEEELPF